MTSKYRIYEYTYPTKHPKSLDPAGRWGSIPEAVYRLPDEVRKMRGRLYDSAGEAEAQCIKLFKASQTTWGFRDYYWVEVLEDQPHTVLSGDSKHPLVQAYINFIEGITGLKVDEVINVSHNYEPGAVLRNHSVKIRYKTGKSLRSFIWLGTMPELLNELSGLNIHD